jgi:hypothetical protein
LYHVNLWSGKLFVLFQVNRFTGNRPLKLPVLLRQNMRIFENYSFTINKSIENCVVCTLLLIRYHLKIDYYQEVIHFDENRQKMLAYFDSNPLNFRLNINYRLSLKKQKVFLIKNLLGYNVPGTWHKKRLSKYFLAFE